MTILMKSIGTFNTRAKDIPRHWTLSDVTGEITVKDSYVKGLKDITKGQQIVVLFHFHKSLPFAMEHLIQTPPHKSSPMGVFSICSPFRPNPIGLSVLSVIDINENRILVKHADMLDGTPILDIKPHIEKK